MFYFFTNPTLFRLDIPLQFGSCLYSHPDSRFVNRVTNGHGGASPSCGGGKTRCLSKLHKNYERPCGHKGVDFINKGLSYAD